jgi:ring-1,2-phenylacetyl-CoA epoxidase subunit PaaC
MPASVSDVPADALQALLLAMADDELILGHRDSEWTGYAPILEEDIAFSNIAQDEMGHALVWYQMLEEMTGKTPDEMAFDRSADEFTCCRFVTYPKGDFAYTVVRQYLFDEGEQVRLAAMMRSPHTPLCQAAEKILREEAYHLMHSKGLVQRLGDATEESHRRMQLAVESAFAQALGMFEEVDFEADLVQTGIMPANSRLLNEWLARVVPVLGEASLAVPVQVTNGAIIPLCAPDLGGRRKSHTPDLEQVVNDLQLVYRIAPGARW